MNFFRSIFGKNADEVVKPAQPVEAGPDPVMAALAELEVKRLRQALAAVTPPPPPPAPPSEADQYAARPSRVVKTKSPLPTGATGPAQNIWDLDEREPVKVVPAAPQPQPSRPQLRQDAGDDEAPEPRRPTRNRTRILGFDAQPTAIVPLFDEPETVAAAPVEPAAPAQPTVMYPAGWLAIIEGPGRGAAFALTQGVSHIGRGADQTVALDFGDMAISRQNHAAVSYDAATHRFQIGHGGKSNLVRLNGKPLLATETLGDGDEIQIGETTLLLKVLCTPAFNWSQGEAEGDGNDMAIA